MVENVFAQSYRLMNIYCIGRTKGFAALYEVQGQQNLRKLWKYLSIFQVTIRCWMHMRITSMIYSCQKMSINKDEWNRTTSRGVANLYITNCYTNDPLYKCKPKKLIYTNSLKSDKKKRNPNHPWYEVAFLSSDIKRQYYKIEKPRGFQIRFWWLYQILQRTYL